MKRPPLFRIMQDCLKMSLISEPFVWWHTLLLFYPACNVIRTTIRTPNDRRVEYKRALEPVIRTTKADNFILNIEKDAKIHHQLTTDYNGAQ